MKFPVLARPVIEAVPCIIVGGALIGTSNSKAMEVLGGLPPMIGTLVVGDPRAPDVKAVTEAALSDTTAPEFTFYVHDCGIARKLSRMQRMDLAHSYANSCGPWVQWVEHTVINSEAVLNEYIIAMRELGYADVKTEELS